MPSAASELGIKSAMVRAGAGAGKTRGLVEKVVEVYRLFQARQELPRIVLTTFTRKATQELKERLILRACTDRDAGLLQFVADPARLQISTIHGLLNIFLRQVGHLSGLDAGFQILNEGETSHLARLALREAVVENPAGLGWLEIYGFDRVLKMCRRYDEALRHFGQLRPATLDDIVRVAEAEAARWREWLTGLAEEISSEVEESSWQAYASSLKSFAATFTGDRAQMGDLPSKPRNTKKQEPWAAWHERTEEFIKEFKKTFTRAGWSADEWPAMAAEWESFAALGADYAERLASLKERQARYSMSDLELKSIEILRAKPFLGAVFAENWDFWMIDEYQDTSPLQIECLQALIGDRPKYGVGDPQQSIYLFRGADVSVFAKTLDEIVGQGGELIELKRNYRSKPDVLLFMNDFMASIGPHFAAMDPREKTADDVPRVCASIIRAPDSTAELKAVIERVQALCQSGARLDQICVLGRTHRNLMDVSRALKDAGFATHVHSSRGFSLRREVIDARALWTFLVNPHDNQNLLILLRSPWFYTEDGQLAEWMADRPQSLWRKLADEPAHASVQRLKDAQTRLNISGLVRTFEETLVEAAYLDLSLANDPAGRKESNLWKLILKARALEREGGTTALDFLDGGAGSDPLDASEGDATSAQEPNCINLMTVHGAKGLEFEHVILPRMGEAPQTAKTVPIEAEDGMFFFPIKAADGSDTDFLASPLDDRLVQRKKRRELEEFDRILYVALTRAKSTLTLTSESEFARESWAARSSFFSAGAGVVDKSRYSFAVVDYVPGEAVETAVVGSAPMPLRKAWRQVVPAAEARQSVTDLVESTARPNSDNPKSLMQRWQAQTLGTQIHRAFEALRYGHAKPEFTAPVEYVLNLKTPPMRELINKGHVEWGFQVQANARVIEGQIDLWGEVGDKIFVVDYKSGSPSHKEDAFAQLAIYAWALRRFGHTKQIQLVVIYPNAKSCETRDFTPTLLATLEEKFGGTHAARQNDFAGAALDGRHRDVEADFVG